MGKTKTVKKVESSSSDSSDSDVPTKKTPIAKVESSDSSDSDVPIKSKKATPAKTASSKKTPKKVASSSSDSDSDDDKPKKSVPVKKTTSSKKATKKTADSSSSDSDAPVKSKKVAAKKAADSSSDSSDDEPKKTSAKKDDSSSSSDDVDMKEDKTAAVEETKAESHSYEQKNSWSAGASQEEDLEVFVGRLSYDATEDDIRTLFETCGEVANVKLLYYPEGNSKGGGFVKLGSAEARDKALELDGSEHMGRWIRVNKAGDKPAPKTHNAGGARERPDGCNTVFVGNLPFTVSEDLIREFFGQCGEINQIRISYHEDGRAKGFGHVEFGDGTATDAAVAMAGQYLGGRPVRVDFSEPRGSPNKEGGFGGGRGGFGGGRGGGFGGGRGGGFGGDRGGFRGGRGGGRGGDRGGFRGGRGGGRGGDRGGFDANKSRRAGAIVHGGESKRIKLS